MKKLALALILTPVFAFAVEGMRKGSYGMAGCGLGSMVFEKNGTFQQVLAATTNGTFGTQTFGITSGTSNCTASGVVTSSREREVFVATNYAALTKDIAKGKGETLSAFTNLLGCSNEGSSRFATIAKSKYSTVYGKTTNADELIKAINSDLTTDSTLATSCKQKI